VRKRGEPNRQTEANKNAIVFVFNWKSFALLDQVIDGFVGDNNRQIKGLTVPDPFLEHSSGAERSVSGHPIARPHCGRSTSKALFMPFDRDANSLDLRDALLT